MCRIRKLASVVIPLCVVLSGGQTPKIYPERWVYAGAQFDTDHGLNDLLQTTRIAAEHGLTGIVVAGLDRISVGGPDYLARLAAFKAYCDRNHLEIIPSGFNTGYGGALLSRDPELAEGLAVNGALFIAERDEARFVADSPTRLVNTSFEQFQGNRFAGWDVQDQPGLTTFADTSVSHSGRVSLRCQNFGKEGIARVEKQIQVTPNRCFRVSAWIKTEDIAPVGLFSIKAFTPDGRDLSPFEPRVPASSEWTRVTTAFNSWYADRIRLNFGVFEGVRGKVWVDDVAIEEVGLMNVIRRAGTPLVVRDEGGGTVYEEGRDFDKVADPERDFHWTHRMPAIRLLSGGRIAEGARLRVDYYHGTTIYNDQVSACPSEAKVREIWKEQFALLQKHLAPKKYLLALDEIRLFNRCQTCRRRHLSAAAILGDQVQALNAMIREVNPRADVWVWSDMWDPNHNAVPRYYLVDGDPIDTWQYLPKDIGIACWYYEKRRASLDFFSSRGFRTLGAAYYDADDLSNPEGWLEALDATPGAVGVMYTTWEHKYKLLGPFGDLVSKRSAK
jgi:hypothetical protein